MTVRCRNYRLILGRALFSTILIGVSTLMMALPTTAQEAEGSILLGSVTRAEIEAAIPDWVSEAMASEPDLEAADRLVQTIDGAEVVVYLGSWCDDTRRELGRFWWALDSLGVDEPPQVTYVAVDRSLTEPADQVAGVGLIRVPTIVVKRGGTELGRIVEESPNGIEIDLVGLLSGEVSGTITASEDLWIEETDSQP
jgi:hypothetical protein